MADGDDAYRWIGVRGTAELTDEGADDHIDALAKKYMGADSYPFRNPAEQHVTVTVHAKRRTTPPR